MSYTKKSSDFFTKKSFELIDVDNTKFKVSKVESSETSDSEYDYLLKFIIIGNYCVGKSSLIHRFSENHFDSEKRCPTIGIDFLCEKMISKPLSAVNGTMSENRYKIHLWDCGGQSRYKTIIRSYFRNANAIILVYDLTNQRSFRDLEEWVSMVKENSKEEDRFEMIIVGSKIDKKNDRVVKWKDASNYAKMIGAHYIEVSSKTDYNVDKVFATLLAEIDKKVRDEVLYL